MSLSAKLGRTVTHLFLIFFSLLTAFPLVLILSMTFKTNDEILATPLALPSSLSLDGIVHVWIDGEFSQYYLNSVLVAVPNVILVLTLAALATYALVQLDLPGATWILTAFLFGFMIPHQALIIRLYYTLDSVGLLNTRIGLALVETAVWLPFAILLLRSFFRNMPRELIEIARLDGAGDLRILGSIVLPIVMPALLTLLILQFRWTWNEFLLALITLQDADLQTVTLGLMRLQGGRYTLNYTQIASGAILTSLPIVIVFFFFQRQFIRGLTTGAIKG